MHEIYLDRIKKFSTYVLSPIQIDKLYLICDLPLRLHLVLTRDISTVPY